MRYEASAWAVNNPSIATPSSELYQLIFECSDNAIFVCEWTEKNTPGVFIEANGRLCRQLGYAKKELSALTPLNFIAAVPGKLGRIRHKLAAERQAVFELECRGKTGRRFTVEANARLADWKGKVVLVCTIRSAFACANPSWDFVSSENRLCRPAGGRPDDVCRNGVDFQPPAGACGACEVRNKAFIEAIPDTIFRISREGVFLDVKPGRDMELLFSPGEVTGKHVYEVLPKKIAQLTMRNIAQAYATRSTQCYEQRLRVNKKPRDWEIRMAINSPDEVLAIVRDITERKRQMKKLKFLSLHDGLTGIYNRTYMEQAFQQIHSKGQGSVGVLMCDIDRLKQVNDTMGHSRGDSLLIAAANIIKYALKKGDIAARIGGDEFVVVLPGAGRTDVEQMYAGIQAGVACHNAAHPGFPISMSIGYAVSGSGPANMNDLIREADANMYREKPLWKTRRSR